MFKGCLAISYGKKLNISMFIELFNQRDPFGSCLHMEHEIPQHDSPYSTVHSLAKDFCCDTKVFSLGDILLN